MNSYNSSACLKCLGCFYGNIIIDHHFDSLFGMEYGIQWTTNPEYKVRKTAFPFSWGFKKYYLSKGCFSSTIVGKQELTKWSISFQSILRCIWRKSWKCEGGYCVGNFRHFNYSSDHCASVITPFLRFNLSFLWPRHFDSIDHSDWQFSHAGLAVSGILFGLTYRYAIRRDENPNLKQGVIGAFSITRSLGTVQALAAECAPSIPLDCGPPFHLFTWKMLLEGTGALVEASVFFLGISLVIEYCFKKKWISKFPRLKQ